MNKGFLFVVIGAIFECAWVYGLKFANSNLEYVLTGFTVLTSTFFFLNSFKYLPTSVAYIFYVGLGAFFVVVVEIAVTREFEPLRILAVFMLMVGIYGLSRENESRNEPKICLKDDVQKEQNHPKLNSQKESKNA